MQVLQVVPVQLEQPANAHAFETPFKSITTTRTMILLLIYYKIPGTNIY
jgi:hypothetical protein